MDCEAEQPTSCATSGKVSRRHPAPVLKARAGVKLRDAGAGTGAGAGAGAAGLASAPASGERGEVMYNANAVEPQLLMLIERAVRLARLPDVPQAEAEGVMAPSRCSVARARAEAMRAGAVAAVAMGRRAMATVRARTSGGMDVPQNARPWTDPAPDALLIAGE